MVEEAWAAWRAAVAEMFDRLHEMRSRNDTIPSFTGERVIGAILFEMTMDREIEGKGKRAPVCVDGTCFL